MAGRKGRRSGRRPERVVAPGPLPPDRDVPTTTEPGPVSSDFLLWQLADSALPIGGFAHSAGLEAAWQHGEVRNRTELMSFLEASLSQLGQASLPFVTAAHRDPDRWGEIDRLCEAFTTNHVANRASRAQGRALLTLVQRTFESGLRPSVFSAEPPCQHFAPAFGASLRALGIPLATAARLFVFTHLRGVLAAAVRLNIVGPIEAQAMQHELREPAERETEQGMALGLDDVAQPAPLIDLWQGTQDRLYSRLFQS